MWLLLYFYLGHRSQGHRHETKTQGLRFQTSPQAEDIKTKNPKKKYIYIIYI